MSSSYWQCTTGCPTTQNLDNVNYICTGASSAENWEQGERAFNYVFPGEGPYVVEFASCCWINLDYGSPSSWSIRTTVNLATRNDTNQPNSSPVTTGKPMYTVQYGCRLAVQIPVADVNGDNIRCRWSTGSECISVCSVLPSATLNKETCTIYFPSNHTVNGIYAVAITIEDFPRSNISIGGSVYTPNDPMTSVNLQFLVQTVSLSGGCDVKPIFVNDTPSEGAVFNVVTGNTIHIAFFIESNETIARVDVTSPAGMTYTSPQPFPGRPRIVFVNTTWTPNGMQMGSHILCAMAEDINGKTSDSRCVVIEVTDVSPCVVEPCHNNGTCIRQGMTQNYTCICALGYTGDKCQSEIDECLSLPCQNHGTCVDNLAMFTCLCHPGYTGVTCETEINECASMPCQNNGSCVDHVNQFTCLCLHGYTGDLCEIDINECEMQPCSFLFDCHDQIGKYSCKLNEVKLAAILLSLALFIAIIFMIILKNKKKYKVVDHSWLSNYLDVRKPDSQPKQVYIPKQQSTKQPNQASFLSKLINLRFLQHNEKSKYSKLLNIDSVD
uniref:Integrin beta-like protein D n=1 Tax=Crassostrea virginica TaxID=6565 RepID=A0A8B8DVR2_CRAVI|nr:integrin beta-like protein D [Crassostrea virginica]